MFDLYAERSPAVYKAAIMLEECALRYRLKHVSVSSGAQHEAAFRALSPNGKIPVLVDHEPKDRGQPIVIFESGAILLYLADKVGTYLPADARQRSDVMEWHFWQSSGLSPMSGQAIHFTRYAPASAQEYGSIRYKNEVLRLYGVLDKQLRGRDYICQAYSIADIGTFPWVVLHDRFDFDLTAYPDLNRWYAALSRRSAVARAYDRMKTELPSTPEPSPKLLESLFGATATLMTPPAKNFSRTNPLES
jgi:GSH-dependent disulfide-bond oxidoreductase